MSNMRNGPDSDRFDIMMGRSLSYPSVSIFQLSGQVKMAGEVLLHMAAAYHGTNHVMCLLTPVSGEALIQAQIDAAKATSKKGSCDPISTVHVLAWSLVINLHRFFNVLLHAVYFFKWNWRVDHIASVFCRVARYAGPKPLLYTTTPCFCSGQNTDVVSRRISTHILRESLRGRLQGTYLFASSSGPNPGRDLSCTILRIASGQRFPPHFSVS